MLISTKGRYALRIMLDLAQQEPGAFIPLPAMTSLLDGGAEIGGCPSVKK